MKTHQVLFSILMTGFVLLSVTVYGRTMDSRDIRLKAADSQKTARSVVPVRASIDGTTVSVSFYSSFSEATISIIDSTGAVVEEQTYQSPQSVQIPIEAEKGDYKIVIVYLDKTLSGDFSIE